MGKGRAVHTPVPFKYKIGIFVVPKQSTVLSFGDWQFLFAKNLAKEAGDGPLKT